MLETIGDRAFANCSGLKEIHLPPTVTRIERSAFYGCTAIEIIYITEYLMETIAYDDMFESSNPSFIITVYLGDINLDNKVNSDDAIYLLRHALFGESYPVPAGADFTGDGKVTSDDAIYLLRHTLFPESYPLANR